MLRLLMRQTVLCLVISAMVGGGVIPVWAQQRVDSLEARLQVVTGDERLTVRVDLMEALYANDPARAMAYGWESRALLTSATPSPLHRRVRFWMARAHESNAAYDSMQVHIEDLERWARAHNDAGGLADVALLTARRVESLEDALPFLEEARTAYAVLDEPAGLARTLDLMGVVYELIEDYDAALRHYQQALAVAEETSDIPVVISAARNLGDVHRALGAYEEARAFYTRSFTRAEAYGDAGQQADALYGMARSYEQQVDYANALIYYQKELALREALGNQKDLTHTYNNLGDVYLGQGQYDEALAFYSKALVIREEQLGDQRLLAFSYNDVGNVYEALGDYEEALAFYLNALALRESLNDQEGLAHSYHNVGVIYDHLGQYEQALHYYNRSLEIERARNNLEGLAISLNNMGGIYQARGHYDEALQHFIEALGIAQDVSYQREELQAYLNIGSVYLQQGHLPEALAATDEAIARAEGMQAFKYIREGYRQRFEILEQQEQFALALAAHKAYKAAHDSLFNAESQGVVAELQQQYRTRDQARQIELLGQRQQIQRLWLGGLGGGALLLALIAGLVYSRYRIRNKAHAALQRSHQAVEEALEKLKTTQAQLIQAEKMASLGQLTAGIAHEIKNPLNFVNNFAEVNAELADELREAYDDNPDIKLSALLDVVADLAQNAAVIQQHGKRADNIIKGMMQHASGGKGQRERIPVNTLVSDHIDLAYHGKRAQNPDLSVQIERDLDDKAGQVEMVPQEVGRVLLNLLGNAFDALQEKATQTPDFEPVVTVATRRVGAAVQIRVADNGPGMSPGTQAKIFEPFFTTKPTGTGTGLGLSLSYDIITQGHGGTLEVESEEGNGAIFSITLPDME